MGRLEAMWADGERARRIAERSDPRARFALVLCGGNVTLDDVAAWRERFGV